MNEQGCLGKVPHNTFAEAKKHIKRPFKSGHHDKLRKQRLDIFKCEQCGYWHVGKSISSQKTGRRANPYRRNKLKLIV